MGVDYDAVGGVGVRVSDDYIVRLIEQGLFTEEEWDTEPDECLEHLGIQYQTAGSGSYGGEDRYYWVVDDVTLGGVLSNGIEFVEKLNSLNLGKKFDLAGLEIIEDIHIW